MIQFTKHALIKLGQRRIKKEFVIITVNNPDKLQKGHSGRMTAYRKFGKLYLKAVFTVEQNNTIIITQHWVEEI